MRCELAPGTRLVIDDLARQFEVSIIPVREALRLLQSEGLVAQRRPRRRDGRADLARVGRRGVHAPRGPRGRRRARGGRTGDRRPTSTLWPGSSPRWIARSKPDRRSTGPSSTRASTSRSAALAGMPILQDMMQRAFDHWDRVRRFYFRDVLIHRTPARAGRAPRDARPDAGARDCPRSRRPSASTTAARSPPTRPTRSRRRRSATEAGASRMSDDALSSASRRSRTRTLFRRHLESARHRSRLRRCARCRRPSRRSGSRSRRTACASATGSASCRWKAGTARPTASRAT